MRCSDLGSQPEKNKHPHILTLAVQVADSIQKVGVNRRFTLPAILLIRAFAAKPDGSAAGFLGRLDIRFTVPDETGFSGIDQKLAARRQNHGGQGFSTLTVLVRPVRAVIGGQDFASTLFHFVDYSVVHFPEVIPCNQTAVDAGLIADNNSRNVLPVEYRECFQGVGVKVDFRNALYVLGAVLVEDPIAIEEYEFAVLRPRGFEPYEHFSIQTGHTFRI